MVRTWRVKQRDGEAAYLRRSRFVAREFSWLEPDKDQLFAPASSQALLRVLPSLLMHRRDEGYVACALDIADAFLSVSQGTDVVVHSNGRMFQLVRMLPGQRDGTVRWYDSFMNKLKQGFDVDTYTACPALFNLTVPAKGEASGLIHVDDVFRVGKKSVLEEVVDYLKKEYKVAVEWLCSQGDVISFLKRTYRLVSDSLLVIQPSCRHVDKLVGLLKLEGKKAKGTPLPSGTQPVHTATSPLSVDEAGLFRTCVGTLLFVQQDALHAQFAIRLLAQHMSSPNIGAMKMLKHLVLYLKSTEGYCVGLSVPEKGAGLVVQSESAKHVFETFTDSDWAADVTDRKSVSSSLSTDTKPRGHKCFM